MDEYPNVAIKIKQSDVVNLKAVKDKQDKIVYTASLKKDVKYQFEIYQVDKVTKKIDYANNPKHYEMTLKEFDGMMKEHRQKAEIKLKPLLEQKMNVSKLRFAQGK